MTKSVLTKLKSLPYLREVVWTTKYLFGARVTPFNRRWHHLRAYLKDLEEALPQAAPLPPRRIVVCGAGDFWVNYLLPVAVVLAGRGAQVDFVMVPRDFYPLPPGVDRFRDWSGRFPPPAHERFRVINLLNVEPAPLTPELEALAARTSWIDTCYLNCKETVDPQGDPKDAETYDFRLGRNREFLTRLHRFLEGSRYDSALTANALISEFGVFYHYCRQLDVRCVSLDSFEQDDCIIAANDGPCSDWLTDDIWREDEPHVLTPDRAERVERRVLFRDNPDLQTDRWHQLQVVKSNRVEELREQLRLDADRPLALLCTNVAWDSAVINRGRAFSTMKEWYLETIRWFAQRPTWQLVVRTHPVEAKLNQPMSVSDHIVQAFPTLPANVRLVRPTDKISTYAIANMSALGLVYTSTVGLEMAVRGLPVIVTGRVHYADRGFTWDPATATDYFALLERAVGPDRLRLKERQVELARCYFDAYFERFPKKMPWRWSHLQEDLKRWPIARIVAGDCPAEYLETFDYLAARTGVK